MSLTAFPRAVVGASLKTLRVPVDAALKLAGHADADSGPALAVDRVEGTVRSAAGAVLRDEELRAEGARKKTAAGERAKAAELSEQADALRAQARRDAAQDRREATERERELKQQAERSAAKRKEDAARRAQEKKQQAAEATAKRKKDAEARKRRDEKQAEQEAARRQKAIEAEEAAHKEQLATQDKKARLAELSDREVALGEKEEALTAADEVTRLKAAAAKAKERRKNSAA